jgi:hypothetical protein
LPIRYIFYVFGFGIMDYKNDMNPERKKGRRNTPMSLVALFEWASGRYN